MDTSDYFTIGKMNFIPHDGYWLVDERKFTISNTHTHKMYFKCYKDCVEECLQINNLYSADSVGDFDLDPYYLWHNVTHRAMIRFTYNATGRLDVCYKTNAIPIQKELDNYFSTFLVL